MKWSLDVGRVAGIRLRVHVTFVVLILLVALGGAATSVSGLAAEVSWIVAVFACVVIHELSHSLVARRFGVTVRDILLLPIGGVSEMENLPEEPGKELAISAAGPIASLALTLLGLGACALIGERPWPPTLLVGPLLARLGWMNALLAGFNLLPALPLDGGRVLRAALSLRMGRASATRVAATCGRVGGILLILAGLFYDFWLMLIGAFVYFGATAEGRFEAAKQELSQAVVGSAMMRDPWVADTGQVVSPDALAAACRHQGALPVTDGGHFLGLLTSGSFRSIRPGQPAGAIADQSVPCLAPEEHLDSALEVLRRSGLPAIAVLAPDRSVIGMVRTADLTTAIRSRGPGHRSPYSTAT